MRDLFTRTLSFCTGVETAESHARGPGGSSQMELGMWRSLFSPLPPTKLQQSSGQRPQSGGSSWVRQQRAPEQRARGLGGRAGCTQRSTLSTGVHMHGWSLLMHRCVCACVYPCEWVQNECICVRGRESTNKTMIAGLCCTCRRCAGAP